MQAGVAMGLAKTVAVRFPEWGPEFATLMVKILALPAACCKLLQNYGQHQLCADDDVVADSMTVSISMAGIA